MQKVRHELRRRRGVERQARSGWLIVCQPETALAPDEADAAFPKFIGDETLGQGVAAVPMNQREHAAAGAAGGDVDETAAGGLAKVHRKIGDDEEMIFLRDAAGLGVVFRDGFVFVAEIHLDDLLHVLVQLRQLLLELGGLRPNAAVDLGLLVIGQVHEAGEILAQPDRIKNGEAQLARRMGRKQPENDVVDGRNRFFASGLGCFKKDGALARIFERERNGKIGGEGQGQPFVLRHGFSQFPGVHFHAPEFRRVFEFRRKRPFFPDRLLPSGKKFLRPGIGGAEGFVDGLEAMVPFPGQHLPA